MMSYPNYLLIALVLAVRWMGTAGCLWCDPKNTSRFTNCLFLEIVSDPTLDVLERDMLIDMKSSLYSASKSISKSMGAMKENIMNGALAGEVSGMIASHSLATGQDPEVATSEVMRLIGYCYYTVTQKSEVHFVNTLRKTVLDFVRDEVYGANGNLKNPVLPPGSSQSSVASFVNQNSGLPPPSRNVGPAPRNSAAEVRTPQNFDDGPQNNGLPPTQENLPFYPSRPNEGNYRSEVLISSNTRLNDRTRNDGISPNPGNVPLYPSETNDNIPANSGSVPFSSSNMGLDPARNRGIPPIPGNGPLYPLRTNDNGPANSGAAAFASSNMGLIDPAQNRGIPPNPGNGPLYPSKTNDNFSASSDAPVFTSVNKNFNDGTDYSRQQQTRQNVPIYPPANNLPPPNSGTNVEVNPQRNLGTQFINNEKPRSSVREAPTNTVLSLVEKNFQSREVSESSQFNRNSFADPPPRQNWQDQQLPRMPQNAVASSTDFSNKIPPGSMDVPFRGGAPNLQPSFSPTNNGFVYPTQDKIPSNQSPPLTDGIAGSQYPLTPKNPELENKPLGPQLPQVPNIPATGFREQSTVTDFSNIADYPGFQQNPNPSANQNPAFFNGQQNNNVVKDTRQENFFKPITGDVFSTTSQTQLGFLLPQIENSPQVLNTDQTQNQNTNQGISNQYLSQKNEFPIRYPIIQNQYQPNTNNQMSPQIDPNNYDFNPAFGTQQFGPSNTNSQVPSNVVTNFQGVASKQAVTESQSNGGQEMYPVRQNTQNNYAPNSNSFQPLVPGSSQANPNESFRNENGNCAKTFHQTLLWKLLETDDLQSFLRTNSNLSVVRDSVSEATRRTFIDIGYSVYSDEVFDYCAILIGSLSERSGAQAYAEKITKSVTDVLLKNNALTRNCVDGAKSVALHILRWLEVFSKSDEKDYNLDSSSSSSSSGSNVPQYNDYSSKDDDSESGSSTQVNKDFYDIDYEQLEATPQDQVGDGNEDCEEQQSENASSIENDDEECDDEQELSSSYENSAEEECDDEQESPSSDENTDDEDCDDEQSESSSSSQTSTNNDETEDSNNGNDEPSNASGYNDRKESEMSNSESKNQIELLMSSARYSMSPSGFNLPGYVSVMAAVADQMEVNHPDWNSNKVQLKTFTQSLVALTQVLQELAYPKSKQ